MVGVSHNHFVGLQRTTTVILLGPWPTVCSSRRRIVSGARPSPPRWPRRGTARRGADQASGAGRRGAYLWVKAYRSHRPHAPTTSAGLAL